MRVWDLKHPVWDTGFSFGTRLPDAAGTIGTQADVKPGTSTMWLLRHGEAHAGHPARSPPSVMEACIIQIPPIAEEDFQILAATAYYSKKGCRVLSAGLACMLLIWAGPPKKARAESLSSCIKTP